LMGLEKEGENTFRVNRIPPKETLRELVLRALAEKPGHGYDIIQRIVRLTGGNWQPAAGSLYPLLGRMKSEGVIDVDHVETSGVRGGKRVVYKITVKGLRELARSIEFRLRIDYLLAVNYALEGLKILRENGLVEEYDRLCNLLQEMLREFSERLSKECSGGGGSFFSAPARSHV